MSIDDLLGENTPAMPHPVPRLTPRAPLSIKELAGILIFGGLIWGAYDRLSHFADKTAVEAIAASQMQMRLDSQHNFDTLSGEVKALGVKVDAIPKPEPKRKP